MSPKTVTGEVLELDDAPARNADLFLVDGNNLAYRAYFALPEELVTSEGFPTNALLGFTNMLVKLLTDYRPRGVAVCWDTKPVHRTAISGEYKSDRRPMPDLLREQFPHFRPIVEAFGYRNLEFEGWEADDVIATLATRADEADIATCVVSTDRDAFQLVSENVCLMMTPRGVADVHVYTPDTVEARLGVTPDKVPDLIGLKGDTSDSIPGIPGIGDKTAAQLMQKYGSLESVLEHASELSPARAKAIAEHADQARDSKLLATMRRDLDIDCDPAELVLAPPDRSQLKEMFRQFEFRALLQRVDQLDEALPAAEAPVVAGEELPWREGTVGQLPEVVGLAVEDGRVAVATGDEVVISAAGAVLTGAQLVCHDAKTQRLDAAEDTLLAAYLIEPGRSGYELGRPRSGVRHRPSSRRRRRTRRRLRSCAAPRCRSGWLRSCAYGWSSATSSPSTRTSSCRSRTCSRRWRTPASRSTPTAWARSRRGSPSGSRSSSRPRTSSPARSSCSARRSRWRASSSRRSALTPGRKGKTGYSTDTKVLQTIRDEHPIVPVIEEWRELTKLVNTYLGPLPGMLGEDGRLHTTINQSVAATGRLSTSNPNLQAIPVRTELGREIRSAFVAEEGMPARLRRLLPDRAPDPRPRVGRAEAEGGVRTGRGHPSCDGCRGARQGPRDAHA